jgi:response regulator RpfG family c-di-GMP phosphodiesterase
MKAPPPDFRRPPDAGLTDALEDAPTVLCVDDEPNVLSALRRLLRPRGYRVLMAGGADEARAALERHDVDVIMADMRMPGTDGVALLEEAAGHWPRVVRILLTGSGDLGTAVDAFNRDRLFRYLLKPWDDEALCRAVREAVEHRAVKDESRARFRLAHRQRAALVVDNDELEARVADRTHELTETVRRLREAQSALDGVYVASVRVLATLSRAGAVPDRGHGSRVADAAYRTARALGVDEARSRAVLLAGVLHDIGMLVVPEPVRDKPLALLTPEEEAVVRRHPLVGEAMLLGLPVPEGTGLLIRQHHERLDGSGYPDGLTGEAIRREARIVAVASDFDDLIEGRLDGRPVSPEAAVRRLVQAGAGYDPEVVAAFLAVVGDVRPTTPAPFRVRDPAGLRPGMVLARDLVVEDGLVLLSAGHRLDDAVIDRLRRAAREIGWTLKPAVRVDPGPPDNGDDP